MCGTPPTKWVQSQATKTLSVSFHRMNPYTDTHTINQLITWNYYGHFQLWLSLWSELFCTDKKVKFPVNVSAPWTTSIHLTNIMLGHQTWLDKSICLCSGFWNNITTDIFLTVDLIHCKRHTKPFHQHTQAIWILLSQAQTAGALEFYSWNSWRWNIHVSPFLSPLRQSGSIKQTDRKKLICVTSRPIEFHHRVSPIRGPAVQTGPRLLFHSSFNLYNTSFELARLEC
jgi:hypothetical protein